MSRSTTHHDKFMREAIREARKGLGRTSPNPAVGAVVVRQNRVIAKGFHRRAGLPHAEVEALRGLKTVSVEDTLYVTLEPCHHHGKTPPCTQTILKSGIRRVVIGTKDPNPTVSGGGADFLRDQGIEVIIGVQEAACRQLMEVFITFVTQKRPFVAAKSALTLDGWTATASGHSKWVTNAASRQFAHRLRDRVDAVMVGVGTVLADNPSLTTRLKRGQGRDPLRIVVDTHLRTPKNATIVTQTSAADTVLVTGEDNGNQRSLWATEEEGISILACPTENGRIDLNELMKRLGAMSVTHLLVEGGASLMGSLLRAHLIDKFYIFKAPKLLGGADGIPMASGPGSRRMDECLTLERIRTRRFGDDILIRGYPVYSPVRRT
ncbi:MAG: bifunctional diaminohydroxyphosphoribosylaminopyrimidine deaminase/5-amino-6-(5-phosphoribosylamino)uracil reductase RibD [Deltaproteobacteria bacterium]|nr:bifunctional diaminohydroxyphosphoribosylaminopyrimidine deaminase/5-amino-6-(5-phosphoribosylamino)uracil reductase RibD [Deltaproteobacteria bacterium]